MLKIGRIHYVNTEPFFYKWPLQNYVVVNGSPRELSKIAREGKLDAAPLPLVDAWNLETEFEILEPYGIAVEGASGSVLLFSRRPAAELADCRIGVTEDSSTSVELLNVMLRHYYKVTPKAMVRGFSADDDAQLLIGNDAMRVNKRIADKNNMRVIDLALDWNAWQNLPFVFAVWVVRRALGQEIKQKLKEDIEEALSAGLKELSAVADKVSKQTGFERALVLQYLNNFTYRFGLRELEAMGKFRQLCAP